MIINIFTGVFINTKLFQFSGHLIFGDEYSFYYRSYGLFLFFLWINPTHTRSDKHLHQLAFIIQFNHGSLFYPVHLLNDQTLNVRRMPGIKVSYAISDLITDHKYRDIFRLSTAFCKSPLIMPRASPVGQDSAESWISTVIGVACLLPNGAALLSNFLPNAMAPYTGTIKTRLTAQL